LDFLEALEHFFAREPLGLDVTVDTLIGVM